MGLVNWGLYNLVLYVGVVWFWMWEVFVYGVEFVLYFCWW